MYKNHLRTVLTPFDHQITIKSCNKSDYIIYTKVLSPKLDVNASNGLSPYIFIWLYFKVLLPYNHNFYTLSLK